MTWRGEVLWRADRYSSEWFRHAVTRVTSKGAFVSFERLDAEPRPEGVPRVVRVRLDVLRRDGFFTSGAFDGPLYTDAGKAKEVAYRLDPRSRPEVREVLEQMARSTPRDAHTWPSTAAEIRRRFRRLALKHHPDQGGDALEFIALKKSYETALARAGG